MPNTVQNVNNINTGLCPHGLAPGACPVCSSSGGGTLRRSDQNRKIGEMTYHECAMIGNMMKARELAQKNHEQNLEQRLENLKIFEIQMQKLSAAMLEFARQMSSNIILKPAAFVIQNIAVSIVNTIKNLPAALQNFAGKIILLEEKFADITDKIAAVFGEIKTAIEKKISELAVIIKSRLFKIFKKNNTDDEDTKIDDDKKIFNLKTILQKIVRKKKQKNERGTEN